MTNPYFNHNAPVTRHTLGRAEQVNQIFEAVAAGFDLLPDPDLVAEGRLTYAVDSGVASAYVVALPITATAYVAGMSITFLAANANGGASTINVDGLGVKAILRANGAPLVVGDIPANAVVTVTYDGTNFRLTGYHGGELAASAASAAAASASASAASGSASTASGHAASALAHWNSFRGVYYGALAADPLGTDPVGNPVGVGDWYYNTATLRCRVYNGSAWVDMAPDAIVEAGTWTPTYSPNSGAFGSITYSSQNGRYMSFANGMVYLSGVLETASLTVGSASGTVWIAGMPFAVSSTYVPAFAVRVLANWATAFSRGGMGAAASLLNIDTTASNVGENYAQVSDMATGASKNRLVFGGWYRRA